MQRNKLVGREPALAAYAVRRRATHTERFTTLLAQRLGSDPSRDMRPLLAVAAAMAAVDAAWSTWLTDDHQHDLPALVGTAHDHLDHGLGALF